jgi:hypothetical protein
MMHAFMRLVAHLTLPPSGRDCRFRLGALGIGILFSFLVGHWSCSKDMLDFGSWPSPWWICGVTSIIAATIGAIWIGWRLVLLVPVLMTVLTAAFAFVGIELASYVEIKLDSYVGIDVAGLAFFAGCTGVLFVPGLVLLRELGDRSAADRAETDFL